MTDDTLDLPADADACATPSKCRWYPWCAENDKCLRNLLDQMPVGTFPDAEGK